MFVLKELSRILRNTNPINSTEDCFFHSSCSYFGDQKTMRIPQQKLSILLLLLSLTAGPPDPLPNNIFCDHMSMAGRIAWESEPDFGHETTDHFGSLRRDFSNEL